MSQASQTENTDPMTDDDISPADEDLDALRRILVGPQDVRLGRLEQRLDDAGERAREVSRVLPDAIVLSRATDGKIARALQPTIEDAIQVSVRKNPKALADVIFPLMGPGIRKAIASTIMGMIQSFNQLLNHSFSLQGLKWRFEAFRTRKPYAEVVLLHTLVYQVEQVLLIHRDSGLVLQHVVGPAVDIQDPDLVSGMLTAIEDFVRDSFGITEDQSLDTLRIGNDRSVWIEQGSGAIIATVIRGTPPLTLRNRMAETLNLIHLKFGSALNTFDGDAVAFEDARDDLQTCLDTEFKAAKRKTSPLLWLIFVALLAAGAMWVSASIDRRQRLERFVADLGAWPGIVVTDVQKRGDRLVITGLKDPLAADPAGHSRTENEWTDPVDYRWRPYASLDPEMVLKRARQLLDPPPTVSLSLESGVLIAAGEADQPWIRRFRDLGTVPVGVQAVRWDRLVDADVAAAIDRQQRLERFVADLEARPGIVVTDVQEHGDRLVIGGLKDPLAADPALDPRAESAWTDPVDYRWRPYASLDPEMVLKRARQLLDPPPTVSLSLEAGVLIAVGEADHRWIDRLRDLGTMTTGVQTVRWDRLVDTDLAALQLIGRRIEKTRIYFAVRSSEIGPDQWSPLESLAADLREVGRLSAIVERLPRVQIIGFTDDSGSPKANLALSQRRAEAVRRFLIDNGTVNVTMIAIGKGIYPMTDVTSGETDQAESRFVTCKLIDGVRAEQENNR